MYSTVKTTIHNYKTELKTKIEYPFQIYFTSHICKHMEKVALHLCITVLICLKKYRKIYKAIKYIQTSN